MSKIKILFINGGTVDYGGISTFLINYINYFNFNEFEVHIAVHGDNNGSRSQELLNKGCIFHQLPVKSKAYFKWKKEYKNLLRENKFDIVHANADAGNGPLLKIAKEEKVFIRISHSHNTQLLTTNKIRVMLNNIQKKEILKYATHLYACSKLAGEWLYDNNNFEIINNAIDYDKFKFDIEKRNGIRKELKIKDDVFVVGHVGRFDYQKNHRFIVELAKNFDEQVLFLLIGDGHLKEEIINFEKEIGVNNILMIGNKDNVFNYYNAMDCFILPSLFEGLSVVSIESQANGLNCLFSNTITQECKISEKTNFYSIKDNKNWIEEINSLKENKKNDRNIILNEKYNAKVQSIELQNKYKGYCNKEV